MSPEPDRVPRDKINDYTEAEAARRRAFARDHTGVELRDVGVYSVAPALVAGNIENFTGVAQVPLGLAGPIRVNGEHAQGDFYVPLATTEGTLVASYSRGMRLLNACGGVKATVVEQFMQRAPVFLFPDAVTAREFGAWVRERFASIKQAAEATTHVGKLDHIEQYQVGPARFLRFNFTTGDAAGQNMCGKATAAACEWIRAAWPRPRDSRRCLSRSENTLNGAHGRSAIQPIGAQQQAIALLEFEIEHVRLHAVFPPEVTSQEVLLRAALHLVDSERARVDEALRDRVIAGQRSELSVAQEVCAAVPSVADHHVRRLDDQARHDRRAHPSVYKLLLGSHEHLDSGAVQREIERLAGRAPPDARHPAYARRDFLASDARGDVAGLGSAHSVEYRVQPEVRLDENDVLVGLSDVAAVSFPTSPKLDHGHRQNSNSDPPGGEKLRRRYMLSIRLHSQRQAYCSYRSFDRRSIASLPSDDASPDDAKCAHLLMRADYACDRDTHLHSARSGWSHGSQ
jgi:hypothetical protein